MRILIVEDNPSSREALEDMLREFGTCDTAENGQKGIEAFDRALRCREPYDLVCMDILMPQMDGQQALKTMRAMECGQGVPPERVTPIIITSALDDERNISEAYYAGGATAFVPKPVEKTLLLDLLKNLHVLPERES